MINPKLLSPSRSVWSDPGCSLPTAASGCTGMAPETGTLPCTRNLQLIDVSRIVSLFHECIKKTENVLFVDRKRLNFLQLPYD